MPAGPRVPEATDLEATVTARLAVYGVPRALPPPSRALTLDLLECLQGDPFAVAGLDKIGATPLAVRELQLIPFDDTLPRAKMPPEDTPQQSDQAHPLPPKGAWASSFVERKAQSPSTPAKGADRSSCSLSAYHGTT